MAQTLLFMWLHLLIVLVLSGFSMSNSLKSLPGYPGELPFEIETGYVSVGDTEDVQLFYYFIESQKNPIKDPVLLWLTGGPGCSAFSGLVFEIGPLSFDYASFNGSLPSFVLNPYSWTQYASIIFLDAPVGTGFSYSTSQEGYYTSDTKSAKDTYQFLRKWLMDHPKFSKNPLYVAGDSYSGVIVPQVALDISNGIIAGSLPIINFMGYMLGNPVTDLHDDENSRIEYFHRLTLISTELYTSVKESCNNEFVNPDPNIAQCMDDIGLVAECTIRVNDAHILEPKCSFSSSRSKNMKWYHKFMEDIPQEIIQSPTENQEFWCRNNNYVLSYIWANDQDVQQALGVRNVEQSSTLRFSPPFNLPNSYSERRGDSPYFREQSKQQDLSSTSFDLPHGTVSEWKRCNKSLAYNYDMKSVVEYHAELIERGYRALIYSGDHDMLIPYVGTEQWIKTLNMTATDGWRPWYVDGQVAGFTEKFAKTIGDGMTFATVKGGGHTAPEYKPKQCLEMANRWLFYFGL